MKKTIGMFALAVLLVPSVACALPLQNVQIEENVSASFVAGETQTMVLSFENKANRNQTTIAELNITSQAEDYPVWKGDFEVYGALNTTTDFQGEEKSEEYLLECEEIDNGSFWCYNKTEGRRIVLSKSDNLLTLNILSDPALYPTSYNFSVDLHAEVGMPENRWNRSKDFTKGKPQTIRAGNSGLTINTTENVTNAAVNVTEYKFTILDSPSPNREHVRSVEFEPDESLSNATQNVRIRISYDQSEISGINESLLKMFYWNETSGAWEAIPSSVNTAENYVEGETDHLSMFSVYGSPISPEEGEPAGGSISVCERKDWNCTDWSECEDGTQTRECEKTASCADFDDLEPSETRSCGEEEVVQECPDCPEASDWSECTDGTQTRTNYRCGENTDYECEEYTETQSCEVGEEEEAAPGRPTGITGRILGNPAPLVAGIILLLLVGAGAYWKKVK